MEQLHGNTQGLKSHHAKALRALYNRRVDRRSFISVPLARTLTELGQQIGRRIGLLIDRQGRVDKVVVGDAHQVFLPDLGRWRAGGSRFRGVRLILTNASPEGLTEDDLTDLALLQLDLVATIHVLPTGLPGRVHMGYLLPPEGDSSKKVWRVDEVASVHAWSDDFVAFINDLEQQFARHPALQRVDGQDAAILVGITLGDPKGAKRSLLELERLADTAGILVVDTALQRRRKLDGRTCIGQGKLQDLLVRAMHLGAEVLIFDRELSPSQLRNIAETTDLKVLDRTQLILDIFAQHASTREGRLQVELAQLRYRMPRLSAMPTAMSRLTGGIGGRGPGETKLEINKRRAQERLKRLQDQLRKLAKNRGVRRSRRTKRSVPNVSLVGYTNAGKSTLLNRLTRSEVLAEDKLFATLDTTSRRFRFPKEKEIVITDTVGFIEDLPKTLIEAFKATLEELEEADLLLHVLDVSDPYVDAHLQSVNDILAQLDLEDRPVMLVWNKSEDADPEVVQRMTETHGGMSISALTGAGCEQLLTWVEDRLFHERQFSNTIARLTTAGSKPL